MLHPEWPDKPVTVTDETVDIDITKYPLFVLDCWASWCGPCKMLGPVINALAKDMKGKAVFGKLNIDENPITVERHKIQAVPTLAIFKDGNLVDIVVGAVPKSALSAKINGWL